MNYRHYDIETFEVGRGLWHARFRRADRKPTMLDGIQFEYLSAKLAWSSVEAASADAQQCIDLMESRLNVQF
jgi:hypothetical protein